MSIVFRAPKRSVSGPTGKASTLNVKKLIDQMSEVWHRLGITMTWAGRTREAGEVFAMLAAREPDHVHWQEHLAGNIGEQGDVDGAIAAYRKILAKHPDRPISLLSIGSVSCHCPRFRVRKWLHRR